MSVLAINFTPQLNHLFKDDGPRRIHCAQNIEQALEIIVREDFRTVIEDTRTKPGGIEDLALLLAATHPGTRIYAFATDLWLPDSDYWQSQGITLLFKEPNPSVIGDLLAD